MSRGNSVLPLLLICISTAAACAPAAQRGSTPDAVEPRPTAMLSVLALEPAAHTPIGADTVLHAKLKYRLPQRRAGATYAIEPLFAERRGGGYTFNAVRNPTDAVVVTTEEGEVELRYAIMREFSDPRLARPVEVWFYVIESQGAGARVIAKAGPYHYPTRESRS